MLEKLGIDSFPTLWLVDKKGVVVDSNFRQLWVVSNGIPSGGTPPATIAKIDAAVEKQLAK